ncbi:MAG: hypothetical protein IJ560_02875 [Alphaproteobacteria bacterium]|nr:hypothetical protein [Alphaproteobacteria bacterium]
MTRFICYNKRKICGMAIFALVAFGGVGTARAANCPANFYLNTENECTYCENAYYCPGDDIRYECPEDKYIGKYDQFLDDTFIEELRPGVSSWGTGFTYDGSSQAARSKITNCWRHTFFVFKNYSCLSEVAYDTTKQEYPVRCVYYYEAGTGYYLSPYRSTTYKVWYNGVKPCTNAPANAHYTGPGTPDSVDGTIKDANDCPWECDDGFGHTSDDRCLPLCRIGETAMNGINIYAEKHTKYAMAVPRGGATCWISAKRGQGGKLVPVN